MIRGIAHVVPIYESGYLIGSSPIKPTAWPRRHATVSRASANPPPVDSPASSPLAGQLDQHGSDDKQPHVSPEINRSQRKMQSRYTESKQIATQDSWHMI